MQIRCCGLSDIGRWRDENQDAFLLEEERGFFIVADGLGGHSNGALAARFAAAGLADVLKGKEFVNWEALSSADLAFRLQRAVSQVSQQLRQKVGGGAGSTAVLALVGEGKAVVANLGDSPAYLLRPGTIEKLTVEHNITGIMVEMGRITPAEAMVHPLRNQLTAYVGMDLDYPASVKEVRLAPGDRLLLCSDGLTGMVAEEDMATALAGEKDLSLATQRLVEMANESGGHDNVTVVLLEID